MKRIEIIVPCYNEEQCIFPLFEEINKVFKQSLKQCSYSILFVNDGSKDKTLDNIKQLAKENKKVKYISLSRNFGKESAIFAGLENCTGDYIVLMDADLQHPPKMIPKMYEEIQKGYDCVGCNRVSRKGEPIIKNLFSRAFYHVINNLTCMKLIPGGSDFRMMTKQMVEAIICLPERERFSKGIMSWVGFDTKWIPYENAKRVAGKSSWSIVGLIKYAINGFVSFATTPLRAVVYLGLIVVLISFIYAIKMFINAKKNGTSGTGFVTIVLLLLFFSGVIITTLGVIGEYLARIYLELKHRPIYIEKESNIKNNNKRK